MKTRRLFIYEAILVIGVCLLAACQPLNGGGNAVLLQSDKARITAPVVSAVDQTALVQGNNRFAIDLYQKLAGEHGNLILSPFSISMALTMVYGGARGNTETQIAQTLHLPGDGSAHAGFNWLDRELENRANGPEGKKNSGFQLSIANSIWGQKGFNFQAAYLDLLAENYGAGLRATDFMNEPEVARKAVNDWVSDETRQKIQDLLPQGSVTPDTRLVLANAIYFYAPWANEFDKKDTQDLPFHLLDGNEVNVPMMYAKERFGYYPGQGFTAVSLPYRGEQVAMLILMPDEGTFTQFENALTPELFAEAMQNVTAGEVQLTMPKFKIESSLDLNSTLASLGMPDAFNDSVADFSGIDGARDLVITEVVHKATIDVNEEGTEAAAATGIIVGVTSMPMENTVTIDRPFIYAIYDQPTGSILFFGKVVNPLQ